MGRPIVVIVLGVSVVVVSIFVIERRIQSIMQVEPFVVVLPHHDVVKVQRDDMLAQLSKQSQPETIILLSPNHFNSGSNNIITTIQAWSVNNGNAAITSNTEVIHNLIQQHVASNEPRAFDYEHGVKNLLGEIKHYFPHAQLVPLIFKSTTTADEIQQLVTILGANCAKCGVIASVDMSHYQPVLVADIHDIKTLRALNDVHTSDIWNVEVDSNAALSFLVQWAKARKLNQFRLFAHTNSGRLANNYGIETTSHIMGYYTAGSPTVVPKQVTFTLIAEWNASTEAKQRALWGTDSIQLANNTNAFQVGGITIVSTSDTTIDTIELTGHTLRLPRFREGIITGVVSDHQVQLVATPDTLFQPFCSLHISSCDHGSIQFNY